MRGLFLVALLMLTGPAAADSWSGDDTGYGRGDETMTCNCAPGEDGIDWNGDGLANADDADAAPPGMYRGSASDGGDHEPQGDGRGGKNGGGRDR